MGEILIPFTFEDMPVRPPLTGRPRISDDLQQTLACLVGWDKTTRRLVFVNPQGVLHSTSPPVKGIINQQSTGIGSVKQFTDITTTEVMLRAKPSNGGRIWVNVGIAAADNTGYPLDGGEWVNFSINNLINLHLYFAQADDYAIIIYTR